MPYRFYFCSAGAYYEVPHVVKRGLGKAFIITPTGSNNYGTWIVFE